jgi:RNA methyltransferase, TrmH family
MTSTQDQVQHITSRDNSFLKDLRRLSQENHAYRKQGRFWVEGDHLCRAALARGARPSVAVFSEQFWSSTPAQYENIATKLVVISDALFRDISGLESPAAMGFVFDLPPAVTIDPAAAMVILDRVQDAGNVGSILRSASAFGFKQVVAIKGTAALWSPKVLRAGMGAHWGLTLIESAELAELAGLGVPLVVTSSHRGTFLHEALRERSLPMPCAWAMGHEGQGVSPQLEARADLHVRIAQPGGEESLNVAAAAAICLQASASVAEVCRR